LAITNFLLIAAAQLLHWRPERSRRYLDELKNLRYGGALGTGVYQSRQFET
jgi:hypothetical protein